jgi:uncharacterized cupin superfamily protein
MTIQQISQTASTDELDSWGTVGIPLSAPACALRGVKRTIPGIEATDTGIWECSPGKFRRQIAAGEVMHILSGECTFTPDDGEEISIQAGDTLYFSPNTNGTWDIHSTVRKVYVLL